MDIGKQVDDIRKKRKKTVKNLTEGIMSESNYSRFSRGKIMIGADVFIHLLSELAFDYFEISEFDHNSHSATEYSTKYLSLLRDEDYEGLRDLSERVVQLSAFEFDVYNIIEIAIEVELSKHENRQIDQIMYSKVKHHLTSVETWSVVEILLFNILIDDFNSELIVMLVENFTDNNKNYIYAEKNSHVIGFLYTAFMAHLSRGEVNLATSTVQLMYPYMEVGLINHKFYLTLAEMLLDVIQAPNTENIQKIVKLKELCLELGNTPYSFKVKNDYELIYELYDLPPIFDK